MNERFFALPEEKQRAILNAGFRVFSRTDYRHASTEAIAREAGISKALLFHYFDGKQDFYRHLYDYAVTFIVERVDALAADGETDFFASLASHQRIKAAILAEHPDMMRFAAAGYLEGDPDIRPAAAECFAEALSASRSALLKRVDRSRFRAGITVEQAYDIALWVSEGIMREQVAEWFDLAAANGRFLEYLEVLKRQFYRKEFL